MKPIRPTRGHKVSIRRRELTPTLAPEPEQPKLKLKRPTSRKNIKTPQREFLSKVNIIPMTNRKLQFLRTAVLTGRLPNNQRPQNNPPVALKRNPDEIDRNRTRIERTDRISQKNIRVQRYKYRAISPVLCKFCDQPAMIYYPCSHRSVCALCARRQSSCVECNQAYMYLVPVL